MGLFDQIGAKLATANTNPLFMAGMGLLGSSGGNGAQAALMGLQSASQNQRQAAAQKLAEERQKMAIEALALKKKQAEDEEAWRQAQIAAYSQVGQNLAGSEGVNPIVQQLLSNPHTAEMGIKMLGSSPDLPANLREWLAFQQMTPDQRAQYLNMKRAGSVFQAGPVPMYRTPDGGIQPLAALPEIAGNEAAVAGARAQATAAGSAVGDLAAKTPAYGAMKISMKALRDAQKNVTTGGWSGASGLISKAIDTQDVKAFNNAREQLNTDLRTIFRIPGEGTLSDKEQAQYGLQLPSIYNDPAINEKILQDIEARVQARLMQGGDVPSPNTGLLGGSEPSLDDLVNKYGN